MSQVESSEISSDDVEESWVNGFCSTSGNIMFCKIDKAFIEDNFNLYGLKLYCPVQYNKALSTILDRADTEDNVRDEVLTAAKLLYGLIHARYIITIAGLGVMRKKYIRKEFGECPRTHCKGQAVLPMGLSDEPNEGGLKLFCPRCQDIYNCTSQSRKLDGCYFGSTFCNLFFMTYHDLVPELLLATGDAAGMTGGETLKYTPRVFGFKIHASSRSLPSADRAQSSDVETVDSNVSEPQQQPVDEEENERQRRKRSRIN